MEPTGKAPAYRRQEAVKDSVYPAMEGGGTRRSRRLPPLARGSHGYTTSLHDGVKEC